MHKSEEILGYRADGVPLYACKPGFIYTACTISCSKCGHMIRGMGGPCWDAKCHDCFNKPHETKE